jgi:hypothetical protein
LRSRTPSDTDGHIVVHIVVALGAQRYSGCLPHNGRIK